MRQRIIAVMNEKAESEADFAKMIGIEQDAFDDYISGLKPVGTDAIMGILSKFMGISAEWLLFGKGNMYVADNAKKSA